MKKKLEAELISIAHRILKLKNKSELLQLQKESQKLYEKLSILVFVEENFEGLQPTIGKSEAIEILESTFDKDEASDDVAPSVEEETVEKIEEETDEKEVIEEPEADEVEKETEVIEEEETVVFDEEEEITIEEEEEAIDDEISTLEVEDETSDEEETAVEEVNFELAFDKKEDVEEVAKESGHQVIFEDFLGDDYKDLEFVKAEIEQKHEEEKPVEETKEKEEDTKDAEASEQKAETAPKQDDEQKVSKGITIGLNDRVGFVNHLFGGSNEDFNRVLSQLNTFGNFEDAKNFIEDLVKPDYNDWAGKEDYEARFLEVVEYKFK